MLPPNLLLYPSLQPFHYKNSEHIRYPLRSSRYGFSSYNRQSLLQTDYHWYAYNVRKQSSGHYSWHSCSNYRICYPRFPRLFSLLRSHTISHEAPDCPASLYHCTQTRNVAILHLPVPLVTVHRYFLLFRPKLHDKYHRPHYASTSSSRYAIRHRPCKLTGTHSGLFHHLWLLSPKTQQ